MDTATAWASVALFDGERVLAEAGWLAGREHSAGLLVEVERLFAKVGRRVDEVTGLVVSIGPGSYTGVRVALSVAKGVAGALQRPAWGVATLDVLALAAGVTSLPVRPVVEAGRSRYATAVYEQGQRAEPMHLVDLVGLAGVIDRPTYVIGDLEAEPRRMLAQVPGAVLAAPAASLRRAGYLAELGWRAAQAGDAGDAASLEGLYLGR